MSLPGQHRPLRIFHPKRGLRMLCSSPWCTVVSKNRDKSERGRLLPRLCQAFRAPAERSVLRGGKDLRGLVICFMSRPASCQDRVIPPATLKNCQRSQFRTFFAGCCCQSFLHQSWSRWVMGGGLWVPGSSCFQAGLPPFISPPQVESTILTRRDTIK